MRQCYLDGYETKLSDQQSKIIALRKETGKLSVSNCTIHGARVGVRVREEFFCIYLYSVSYQSGPDKTARDGFPAEFGTA